MGTNQATGKTALVTGASSGIGRELADLLANDGYDLILVARSREALDGLAGPWRALGRKVDVLAADLSQPGAGQLLYEQVNQLGRAVDLLVNNAGIGSYGAFHEIEPNKDLELLQLNVMALTALTRLFLPGMVARKQGRILNVASLAAFQPGPFMATYCASKAFVLSLSEAINCELEGTGVTVTALCPGPVPTKFQQRSGNEHSRVNSGPMLDARTVALLGYRGLMNSQSLVLPGFKTKMLAFGSRLVPRSWTIRVSKRLLKPR